jgi:hypothetical protein
VGTGAGLDVVIIDKSHIHSGIRTPDCPSLIPDTILSTLSWQKIGGKASDTKFETVLIVFLKQGSAKQ